MKCKIVKSLQNLDRKNTNRQSAYNHILSQLKSWEDSFGINSTCSFDQTIRFASDVVMNQFFYYIKKLTDQGFIEPEFTFEHIRQDFVKSNEEWELIDYRVQRLARNGKITLVPYSGRPYQISQEN
jgi:hypothetical protein